MKAEYRLLGLNCANCAAKIETALRSEKTINTANIVLMEEKLLLEYDESQIDEAKLHKSVEAIVHRYEPDVNVVTPKNEKEDEESSDEKKEIILTIARLAVSMLIAILVVVLNVSGPLEIILMVGAFLLAGYEVAGQAVKNIFKGEVFDENFLMTLASILAFIVGEHIEAIAVLVFYGVGELLQDVAVSKSRRHIKSLMDIRPDYANLVVGNETKKVAPEEVKEEDKIVVLPGERIPLDGVIVSGESFLDTRAVTGESEPVAVNKGDTVYSGTVNINANITLKVTSKYEESTVSRILKLVESAQQSKANTEQFITKFAKVYTPIVVGIAVFVAILPPIITQGSFSTWIYRAISFLIVSCPCALVLSIPLSFFAAVGAGARKGILIKGGNYLEAMTKVDTLVCDKTGTLTKGVFVVTKTVPANGCSEKDLLYHAAVAEQYSPHPIAKAILQAVENKELPKVSVYEEPGMGICATMHTDEIYVGNERLMREKQVKFEVPEVVQGSIIYVAKNQMFLGYILVADEVKENAADVVKNLKRLGLKRCIMLSGDQEGKAKLVADECQLDAYYANLLPQDKVECFKKIKNESQGLVMFVGDGMNDAPVLALADVGVAMGEIGSDAAIEAADMVIAKDNLAKLVTAFRLSRKTKKIIHQNIVFSLGVKVIVMLLSFFGKSTLWLAIFADVGVALLAVLNSLRTMLRTKDV